jgi:hypothetical protein
MLGNFYAATMPWSCTTAAAVLLHAQQLFVPVHTDACTCVRRPASTCGKLREAIQVQSVKINTRSLSTCGRRLGVKLIP